MKQEILRFENVTCKKDGAVYLDNFSFYMTAGEIVGLLSVNDRGIKELIELMAKNHPIDAGRVYMGGKQSLFIIKIKKHIQYISYLATFGYITGR